MAQRSKQVKRCRYGHPCREKHPYMVDGKQEWYYYCSACHIVFDDDLWLPCPRPAIKTQFTNFAEEG